MSVMDLDPAPIRTWGLIFRLFVHCSSINSCHSFTSLFIFCYAHRLKKWAGKRFLIEVSYSPSLIECFLLQLLLNYHDFCFLRCTRSQHNPCPLFSILVSGTVTVTTLVPYNRRTGVKDPIFITVRKRVTEDLTVVIFHCLPHSTRLICTFNP